MSDERQTLTRAQLYELIWSKPATTVAADFGVSSVAVKKACRRLNVPTPPPGYWTKLAHGKKVVRPNLPPADGQKETTTFGEWHGRRKFEPPVDTAAFATLTENQNEEIHPLARKTKTALRGGEVDRATGILRSKAGLPHLPIHVTRSALDRATRIVSRLILLLENNGFTVEPREKRPDELTLIHQDTRISVAWSLSEIVDRYERERKPDEVGKDWIYDQWRFRATGRLRIMLDEYEPQGGRKSWGDGKIQRLETELPSVASGFLACIEAKRAEAIKRQEWEREWKERERVRQQAEMRKKEEQKRRDGLVEAAEEWHQARQLREFIGACEAALRSSSGELAEQASGWLEWARRIADQKDPLHGDFVGKAVRDFIESATTSAPPG